MLSIVKKAIVPRKQSWHNIENCKEDIQENILIFYI